jgi:type I restriction enzyme M protein
MQDDMYLIATDGWKAELILLEGKKGEMECDLVPKYLVINRYFSSEKKVIEELQVKVDNAEQEIEGLVEENSGEDGCFDGFDKVNKASVIARIKEIKGNKDYVDELKVMEKYLVNLLQCSELRKKIKEVEKVLDNNVIEKYKKLTEQEIKVLVVDDKWMEIIEQKIKGEMDRISQKLTQRIKELSERYAEPLPEIVGEVETLSKKVEGHLSKMGFNLK